MYSFLNSLDMNDSMRNTINIWNNAIVNQNPLKPSCTQAKILCPWHNWYIEKKTIVQMTCAWIFLLRILPTRDAVSFVLAL